MSYQKIITNHNGISFIMYLFAERAGQVYGVLVPVHKAFQNQDQDQTQFKHSSTMDYFFKTYYNYLTID